MTTAAMRACRLALYPRCVPNTEVGEPESIEDDMMQHPVPCAAVCHNPSALSGCVFLFVMPAVWRVACWLCLRLSVL
eukprot:581510-Rhodomonas_salina.3